jgi:septum formation inhibitor-activating ATPase MinD
VVPVSVLKQDVLVGYLHIIDSLLCHCTRDADRVAGLLEANNIYNVKLLVNRVRPDMIQRNDMMSVRDVQVGLLKTAANQLLGYSIGMNYA